MSESGAEPHWWVSDVSRALKLWTEVLGFSVTATFPDAERPTWVQLRRGGATAMLAARPDPEKATGTQAYGTEAARRIGLGGPVSVYFRIDDVDEVHARALASRDCTVVEPLWDAWWGLRQFTIADPDGNWVTLCRPAE